jgi:malate dehydrogenase
MTNSVTARAMAQWAAQAARGFAASAGTPARKVAVLGAAGGIGQPLSLLLKVRVRLQL